MCIFVYIEGAVSLHLPNEPLKTHYGLEPVPRCEPSTYNPIRWWLSLCVIGASNLYMYVYIEGEVSLQLPIEPLKTHSGLEPVLRCEPSTYNPISWWHNHCAISAGNLYMYVYICVYRGWGGWPASHWAFKNPLQVGAGTEMWTQYLPAH